MGLHQESCKPYFSNREQKLLLLVVSLTDVLIGLDFACPVFICMPDRRGKLGCLEVNLSSAYLEFF